MHQLYGAYERVNRAREHLEDLKPQVNALRQAIHNRVSFTREPDIFTFPNGRKVRAVRGSLSGPLNFPAPPRISTLIGEVVQNLRTALDYLVYELACFDAKRIVDRTQFPVADTEERFKELLGKYKLKGLTPEHIAAIKRLQPCDGCQWTRCLSELSNPDKHRHLTAVRSPILVTPSPGSTEAILAGKPVDVKGDILIRITFSDGTPVVETLEQLQSEVAQVLDAFKPDFE